MTSAELHFLNDPPRFLFFTGKGGVGKTSIACATALALVSTGKRVLLVSTDPASNVGQVFGVQIGNTVTAMPDVAGLAALEIDPEAAAADYRERVVGPMRGLLPDAEIASMIEQLSGSCTTEVASFDEFTALLTDADGAVADFDHVLFDTAPTGHTIRLLQLPGNWTEFLETGKGDASCLGPLAGLDKQKSTYGAAVAARRPRPHPPGTGRSSVALGVARNRANTCRTGRTRNEPPIRRRQRRDAGARGRYRPAGYRRVPPRNCSAERHARHAARTAAGSYRPQGRQYGRS